VLRRSVLACLLTLAAVACGGGNDNPNNPTPQPLPTGPADLVIEDIVVGTGAEATGTKLATVNYVLYNYDPAGPNNRGTVLQAQQIALRLGANAVIPGFERGVVGMREGGQRRITVPPSLAYGAAGFPPSIPGNAWLVFDLQLVTVAD